MGGFCAVGYCCVVRLCWWLGRCGFFGCLVLVVVGFLFCGLWVMFDVLVLMVSSLR